MVESLASLTAAEDDMLGAVVQKRSKIVFRRGEGMHLFDSDDRRFLDMTSAQGVAMLGHAHPLMREALERQAALLMSLPSFLYGETRGRFLQKLSEVLPPHLPHVYLCNSGSEAIEVAIKFAKLATGRTSLVAASKGFHGRTAGAFTLTWSPKTKERFAPLLPDVSHTPYNRPERLSEAVSEETAGFFLEVVQGEGGVNQGSDEFLREAQNACREQGALLIVDEIQTGFGRTGKWFGFQHSDLEPDIVCLAKGLGAGFPMGAVAYSSKVREKLFLGAHGSTFGGNPLACAAGLAALTAYQDLDIIGNAQRMGEYLFQILQEKLAGMRVVRQIRGRGLLIGVELRTLAGPFMKQLMEEHQVLVLNAGPRVLRLLPALIVEPSHADEAAEAMATVLGAKA